MDITQGIKLLKEQIRKAKDLAVPPAFNPQYKVWEQTTLRILNSVFDKDTVRLFTSIVPSRAARTEDAMFHIFGDVLKRKTETLQEILDEHERLEGLDISLAHEANTSKANPKKQLSNEVFVVHGHDLGIKDSVARFLESIDLNPIILHEQPNKGRTIIEKFEDYSDVGFAIVIFTADDCGGKPDDSPENYKKRARQNVVLELGFFLGRLGRERVCTLYEEGVEIPSDYDGVLFVHLDDGGAWRFLLGRELREAGLSVDLNKIL